MRHWNEETLRAAASWKAFKEGKSLLENGSVIAASETESGWRGTVSSGKRPIRVSVTARSASDLEARCPCPANQATGEFCAHAVATGLATLAGGATPKPPAREFPVDPPAKTPVFDLILPPSWQEAMNRGKLALSGRLSQRDVPDPADIRLAHWLTSHKVDFRSGFHLHLDSAKLPAFLEAIQGHPGVTSGQNQQQVEITSGHQLEIEKAEAKNDQIHLRLADGHSLWHEIGGSFWQIGANFIKQAGTGTPSDMLRPVLAELTATHAATLPSRTLLSHIESWQDWLHFPHDCWLESLHFVPSKASFTLHLDGTLEQLNVQLTVSYPNSHPVPPGSGEVESLPRLNGQICEIRDNRSEMLALARLQQAGFQTLDHDQWTLKPKESILSFLVEILPLLANEWEIQESPRFAKTRQQFAVVSPRIDIIGSGDDWLRFDLKFQTADGIEVSRDEIRSLISSKKGLGTSQKGRQIILSKEFTEIIEPLLSELDIEQIGGQYEANLRSGEVVLDIRNKLLNSFKSNEESYSQSFEKPPSLHVALRSYQASGAAWLTDRVKRFGGALLADDMGLGKTIQSIALIEQLLHDVEFQKGRILVIATTSLLGNWRAEFARFAPSRKVRILHGTRRNEEQVEFQPGEVAITSYGTLTRDLAWHLRQDYLAVIADEASLIRNPDTDHAKALSKLRARCRIALTGTPIENGVRDLWSIFRFIQPGWLGSREEFKDRYESSLADPQSSQAVIRRLKMRVSPFMLRRTKEEVAPELPSKLLIDEFCDLSSDQQKVYRELLDEGRRQVESLSDGGNQGAARMKVLTTLLRLRQACCDLGLFGNDRFNQLAIPRRSAKGERLMELLNEAVESNHRVLIFSQFQKQLLEIEKWVSERDWSCLRLDGQTRNRQELVERFQAPDGPPVFLISLKAGGYGLNLTAADTVIHFDPWWNPAAEAQATDRAHRIGQTRPVTVYRLLTRGTVEEKVVGLQARKRALAAALDETGQGDATGWSMEELKSVILGVAV